MNTFEIQDSFLLNGKPFQILSGAIHYFRVHPDDWRHSLRNLKALGFNTVETYVPWNMHEPKEGEFNFSGFMDLEKFLQTAKEEGLYAIVRPSPFICAEWEFGGMPAWLLEKDLTPRSRDPKFLEQLDKYYDQLMPILKRNQLSEGGNVLMFQVENEYGSYFEDKEYLRAVAKSMKDRGLNQPFFTSDGPWRACLRAGSMIEDGILPTGNFGSRPEENFAAMESFFEEHGKKFPLMCMEFWDGWFNRWGEPIIKRDKDELVDAVIETMKRGSINLYMFHGGTNFGFMNGCSARKQHDLPQITSYDYGAFLDEQGNPTEQYYKLQKRIQEEFPELETFEPLVKESMSSDPIVLKDQISLFEALPSLSTPVKSLEPLNMEALGQNTGFVLYQTQTEKDADQEKLRIIDARDRAQVYLNDKHQASQYQEEIGDDIMLDLKDGQNDLKILVENMGRVNYGSKLLSPTQHKGISRGVMIDLHFLKDWINWPLPLDDISKLEFNNKPINNQPGFYRFETEIETPKDTFIDMTGFGKGVVFVNGFNVGRYWNKGPLLSLYVPSHLLKPGTNEIVVFDTEGNVPSTIRLSDHPIEMEIETKGDQK